MNCGLDFGMWNVEMWNVHCDCECDCDCECGMWNVLYGCRAVGMNLGLYGIRVVWMNFL